MSIYKTLDARVRGLRFDSQSDDCSPGHFIVLLYSLDGDVIYEELDFKWSGDEIKSEHKSIKKSNAKDEI